MNLKFKKLFSFTCKLQRCVSGCLETDSLFSECDVPALTWSTCGWCDPRQWSQAVIPSNDHRLIAKTFIDTACGVCNTPLHDLGKIIDWHETLALCFGIQQTLVQQKKTHRKEFFGNKVHTIDCKNVTAVCSTHWVRKATMCGERVLAIMMPLWCLFLNPPRLV